MPASFLHQVYYEKKPIWMIPAIHKKTGSMAIIKSPVTVGSPRAIFRDLPEYIPYMPGTDRALAHLTQSLHHSIAVLCNSRELSEEIEKSKKRETTRKSILPSLYS